MKPSNVFQLELSSAFYSRRSLIMKILFTFLLSFPFVVIAMPLRVRIAGLMMLLIFSSFFGAAVTIVRRRSDGLLGRLRQLPVPAWKIMGDFTLSGAVVDIIQMGSVLTLFLVVSGQGLYVGSLMITAGLFCATVVLLNILGIILGFMVKSNSEVHLAGAFLVGIIALISDLLPVPSRLEWIITSICRWNPLTLLHHSLYSIVQNTAADIQNDSYVPVFFIIVFVVAVAWRAYDWKGNSEGR
ncbi:hypothetical protein ACFL47_04960 [Candidatus Latescibacterota bacterium]